LADRLWQRDCGDDGEPWLGALRACVQQLDGRPRQVVELFNGDGLDRDAIAAGLKETGIKTLLQRVRTTLRRCSWQRRSATASCR